LTKGIVPDEFFDMLKPEAVAPLSLYLCSEGCPVTGAIYDAGAGYFDRSAIVTGPGIVVGDGKTPPTPEDVMGKMAQIKSLKDAETFDSATAALGMMLEAFNPAKAAAASDEASGPATVADVFAKMPSAFLPDKAGGTEVTFQFNITGAGGGQWNAVIKGGVCAVTEGAHGSPTTTIIMASDDFLALIGGQLNPMKAYTSGKLKIEGDLMKSQLIEKLFAF
jgi:putative sterol carrier protein